MSWLDGLRHRVHTLLRPDDFARESEEETALTALRERFETLTTREREVMTEVVKGRMNKQIAGDIGISEITVRIHRGQVMRKMQAKSLPDLARMADKLKLTPERSQVS